MNAVLRQAVGEISRGLSTGLVTWAASSPRAPHLVCAVCPDCVCSCRDGVRSSAVSGGEGGGLPALAVAFGFVLGVAFVLAVQPLCGRSAAQVGKGKTAGRGAWLKLES